MPIILERLSTIKDYRDMFERGYPGEGITAESVAKALASFERTIVLDRHPVRSLAPWR